MADTFSYAVLRLVPALERGERINVGVVVFCRPKAFLQARTALDDTRARALWPDVDFEAVTQHLKGLERIAAGDADAGPIAQLDLTGRFHWLAAPSSTIVQPSEVHTGICDDLDAQVERLFRELVTG